MNHIRKPARRWRVRAGTAYAPVRKWNTPTMVMSNGTVSHRDESACVFGEGNLSSSFRMALMSGTAGSWGDRFASELMNSVCTVGRWNGPALRGRGKNIDWSEPAHASPGDSAQHELAAVAVASPSSSADVLGRPDGWPPEVAEDLYTYWSFNGSAKCTPG